VPVDASDLERIFREESGRVVATLVRLFGDIDIAEEMAQEAFLVASDDDYRQPRQLGRGSALRAHAYRRPDA